MGAGAAAKSTSIWDENGWGKKEGQKKNERGASGQGSITSLLFFSVVK
jgi:hypothetical protein